MRSLAAALARRQHDVLLVCAKVEGSNPIPQGCRVVEIPERADLLWFRELFVQAGTDAVLERYSLGSGAALAAAADLGLRGALEVNAPLVEEAVRFRGLPDAPSWRERERALLTQAESLIVVSTALRERAIASGAVPERITLIPNGADLESFGGGGGPDVRARLGLGPEIVVGFVGSLKPWHGVGRLVEAMSGLPPGYCLLVVGEGPERVALEQLSTEVGLRAIFTGDVPHLEVPGFLDAMDIGVAPFEPMPGFYFSPLKVVEYMAAGLPVVATRQGDLPELLADSGLLVQPGDVAGLRAALLRLGADAELRMRLGNAARDRARKLGWDSVADRVEGVLTGSPSVRTGR
jgi:glycosyltransferase involved in cell wall biosynthesis